MSCIQKAGTYSLPKVLALNASLNLARKSPLLRDGRLRGQAYIFLSISLFRNYDFTNCHLLTLAPCREDRNGLPELNDDELVINPM